jgi:hypothetical protein
MDNLNGKYHLSISLEPKNIDDLRKEHEPIDFMFNVEIVQGNYKILKEYEYKLEKATIGFTPFVIFEMPKDIKYKLNEEINIIFKDIKIDEYYYTNIKFIIYKSKFKYRTD